MSDGGFAYRGAAWREGPGIVYDRLAAALLAAGRVPLAGALVLDVGAGSGAASKAVVAGGGHPVAVDLSLEMMGHERKARPAAVVGDACRLPLAPASVDAAVLAFVLSHVPQPVRAFGEARRVVRPGGAVLASSFPSGSSHPCKSQVQAVAVRWGWRPPPWYEWLKSRLEPQVGSLAALAELAAGAGLRDVVVEERLVDTGVYSPEALVAWRLGMAHLAPFVASLPAPARAALVAEARTAVGPAPQRLGLRVLMLSSRSPAQRRRVPA
ncbi:MAG: class I SAM-dependent methyltransferase [Actinobacteria bacterium]|nr:class I SAM-dependent methyltransferase [Actinomycetota bacterium]